MKFKKKKNPCQINEETSISTEVITVNSDANLKESINLIKSEEVLNISYNSAIDDMDQEEERLFRDVDVNDIKESERSEEFSTTDFNIKNYEDFKSNEEQNLSYSSKPIVNNSMELHLISELKSDESVLKLKDQSPVTSDYCPLGFRTTSSSNLFSQPSEIDVDNERTSSVSLSGAVCSKSSSDSLSSVIEIFTELERSSESSLELNEPVYSAMFFSKPAKSFLHSSSAPRLSPPVPPPKPRRLRNNSITNESTIKKTSESNGITAGLRTEIKEPVSKIYSKLNLSRDTYEKNSSKTEKQIDKDSEDSDRKMTNFQSNKSNQRSHKSRKSTNFSANKISSWKKLFFAKMSNGKQCRVKSDSRIVTTESQAPSVSESSNSNEQGSCFSDNRDHENELKDDEFVHVPNEYDLCHSISDVIIITNRGSMISDECSEESSQSFTYECKEDFIYSDTLTNDEKNDFERSIGDSEICGNFPKFREFIENSYENIFRELEKEINAVNVDCFNDTGSNHGMRVLFERVDGFPAHLEASCAGTDRKEKNSCQAVSDQLNREILYDIQPSPPLSRLVLENIISEEGNQDIRTMNRTASGLNLDAFGITGSDRTRSDECFEPVSNDELPSNFARKCTCCACWVRRARTNLTNRFSNSFNAQNSSGGEKSAFCHYCTSPLLQDCNIQVS